jgi:hypothetical protein
LYIRKGNAYERSTPVTANETWARTRFEAVALAVRARQTDLMNINTDKEAFLAQRDQAGGKRTFKRNAWCVPRAAWILISEFIRIRIFRRKVSSI